MAKMNFQDAPNKPPSSFRPAILAAIEGANDIGKPNAVHLATMAKDRVHTLLVARYREELEKDERRAYPWTPKFAKTRILQDRGHAIEMHSKVAALGSEPAPLGEAARVISDALESILRDMKEALALAPLLPNEIASRKANEMPEVNLPEPSQTKVASVDYDAIISDERP